MVLKVHESHKKLTVSYDNVLGVENDDRLFFNIIKTFEKIVYNDI